MLSCMTEPTAIKTRTKAKACADGMARKLLGKRTMEAWYLQNYEVIRGSVMQ